MVEEILADNAIRHRRKAQGVLRLADRYGPQRLDISASITQEARGFLHPPECFAAMEVVR